MAAQVLLLAPLTSRLRFAKKVFLSSEDAAFARKWLRGGVVKNDDDIERIRRAHRNDLENIPVFLVTGLSYLYTAPCPRAASLLFLVYLLARTAHTVVYALWLVPQPARTLCWTVGYAVNLYMAVLVVARFTSAL